MRTELLPKPEYPGTANGPNAATAESAAFGRIELPEGKSGNAPREARGYRPPAGDFVPRTSLLVSSKHRRVSDVRLGR